MEDWRRKYAAAREGLLLTMKQLEKWVADEKLGNEPKRFSADFLVEAYPHILALVVQAEKQEERTSKLAEAIDLLESKLSTLSTPEEKHNEH
jgi:hypothetical protein